MVLNQDRALCAAALQDSSVIERVKKAKISPHDLEDVCSKKIYAAILKAHDLGEASIETVKIVLMDDDSLKNSDKQLYCQVVDDLGEAEVSSKEFTIGYLLKQKEAITLSRALRDAVEANHAGTSIEKIKETLFDKLKSSSNHDIEVKIYEDTMSERERQRMRQASGEGMLKFPEEFRHLRAYFPYGLAKGTMTVIQGSTNAGKSVFLANLVWIATRPENKLNVLYIFSENREVEALSRLDAVILGKPYKQLYDEYLTSAERASLTNRDKEGHGKIVYFQPEFENFDASQVEAALEDAKAKGYPIDVIMIDSPDHMKPGKSTGTYFVDKPQVWKDLKALMQRWEHATVGTWPLKEEFSGQGKGDKEPPPLTANSGAGGQDVARPMDNIIAFSYDERADDLMSHRLFVVTKCRDGRRDFAKIRYRILDNLRFVHADDFNAQFAPRLENDMASIFGDDE